MTLGGYMTTQTKTIKVALSADEYRQLKEHINCRGEKIQYWTRRAMLDKLKAQSAKTNRRG